VLAVGEPALVDDQPRVDLADLSSTLLRVDRIPADPVLLATARAALPDAHVLPIGTTARVGGGTGCDVEAMEGFAVLRAAQLAGVPALEVRAVSNSPGEPDRSRWLFRDALDALERDLPTLVAALSR